MEKKVFAVLIILIGATIISSILAATYTQSVKNIYAFKTQTVTLEDNTTVTTPAPLVPSDVQVQIYGLAPVGVWMGAGLAIFLMFFHVGRGGVSKRD
jgi:hypothetical protein